VTPRVAHSNCPLPANTNRPEIPFQQTIPTEHNPVLQRTGKSEEGTTLDVAVTEVPAEGRKSAGLLTPASRQKEIGNDSLIDKLKLEVTETTPSPANKGSTLAEIQLQFKSSQRALATAALVPLRAAPAAANAHQLRLDAMRAEREQNVVEFDANLFTYNAASAAYEAARAMYDAATTTLARATEVMSNVQTRLVRTNAEVQRLKAFNPTADAVAEATASYQSLGVQFPELANHLGRLINNFIDENENVLVQERPQTPTRNLDDGDAAEEIKDEVVDSVEDDADDDMFTGISY
jgi:hypothetical protein